MGLVSCFDLRLFGIASPCTECVEVVNWCLNNPSATKSANQRILRMAVRLHVHNHFGHAVEAALDGVFHSVGQRVGVGDRHPG